jgi:AcrR family transcriptional regulator
MAPKGNKTKELFIKTADKLFFQRGYDDVSVDEICKAAGKAKGLFFYYFEKKENVVKLLLEMQVERISRTFKRRLKEDKSSVEKMNMLMQALFTGERSGPRAMYYFKECRIPEWADSFAHHLKDVYIFPLIQEVVAEGLKNGEFIKSDDLQVEIIYLGISKFMHNNFDKMSDEEYAVKAILAVTSVLEKALGVKNGTIKIMKG